MVRSRYVDVNYQGRVIKGGVKLFDIGVNAGKDLLFNRIRAGMVSMSARLPTSWFEQLTAEQRIEKRTAKGTRWVWTKKLAGARNEALDCAVGALWVTERLGIGRWPKAYWDNLQEKVTRERPATPPPQDEIQQMPMRRALRRRGSINIGR
jgi:phage terminase large subunit GpA-like protein